VDFRKTISLCQSEAMESGARRPSRHHGTHAHFPRRRPAAKLLTKDGARPDRSQPGEATTSCYGSLTFDSPRATAGPCRSRICLLLAFGCNGAFGTAHEPGVARDTRLRQRTFVSGRRETQCVNPLIADMSGPCWDFHLIGVFSLDLDTSGWSTARCTDARAASAILHCNIRTGSK
jgi:hypothetical protein